MGRTTRSTNNTSIRTVPNTPRGRAQSVLNNSLFRSLDQQSTSQPKIPKLRLNTNKSKDLTPTENRTNPDSENCSLTSEFLGFEGPNQNLAEKESGNQITDNSNILLNMSNTNVTGPLGTNSLLMESIQAIIRESQTSMQAEMAALRTQISGLQNAPSTSAPVTNTSFESTTNSPRNLAPKIDLEKWKVFYDGTSNVSDFLFKIETLARRTQCPDEHLLANFQIFLSGKAEIWYWDFVKQERNMTYSNLRYSITKEFGTLESDHEILMRISGRKQLSKESFDDFYSSITSMNLRMRQPIAESTLIDILKRNSHTNLKLMLFNADARSAFELRDYARRAEKVLMESKVQFPSVSSNRHVSEIDNVVEEEEYELDPQIDAFNISKRPSKPDYSKIKCWNCLALGHSYIYCTDEQRHVFCYKCGNRGVSTVKCPNPHTGNRKRSEMATGDSRSNH